MNSEIRTESKPIGRAPVLTILRVALPALALQLAFGSTQVWGVVAPAVLADGWPPLLVSAVYSGSAASYGAFAIWAGRLADRLPPRRLCWISVALLWAGFAFAFAFPSSVTFILGYSGLALGLAGAIGGTGALAAGSYVAPQRVGAVGGLLTAAYGFAAVVQAPVLARLIAAYGWLAGLRIMCAALALLTAGALLMMPRVPARDGPTQEQVSLGALLRLPALRAGCLMELCATPLGAYAMVVLAVEARNRGFGLGLGALAITMAAAASVAGRLLAGTVADRVTGLRICATILAIMLVAAVLLAAPLGPVPFRVAALVVGLGYGSAAGTMARLGVDAAPAAPTTAFGVLYATFCAGSAIGPLLGAAVGGRSAWVLLGGLALVGLGLLPVAARRRGTVALPG